MEITVRESRENPLLDREEFELEVDHEGEATPSADKVRKTFAAENDLDPEKIDVEHVYNSFGRHTARVILKAYEEKVVTVEEEEPVEDEAEEQETEAAEETAEDEQDDEATEEAAEDDTEETGSEETPEEDEKPEGDD